MDAAIQAYRTALALAERQPPVARDRAVLDVVAGLARALLYAGRPEEAAAVLLEHEPAVARVDDDAVAARHHFWLGHICSFLDEPARAIEHGQRSLVSGTRAGDRAAMGRAHYVIGRTCFRLGDSARGIAHARQAIALLDTSWLGYAHWALGLNLGLGGWYVDALAVMSQVRELAVAAGDVRLEAYAE